MSFGGGYQGGRTRMQTKVFVNVYDLSPMNDCLFPLGIGLHHSGVEILGSEYSFASGAGIFEAPPRMAAPGAVFREQIEMGAFDGGHAELKRIIADMQAEFKADGDYNLIYKNCNHFANSLCWRLLRKPVPAHVNRLSNIGAFCACLLPRQLLENAPVGDPNANNNGGDSETKSFLMYAPPGRQASSSTSQNSGSGNNTAGVIFSGAGARLGGSSMTSTPSTTPIDRGGSATANGISSGSSASDLTDRRERARKAALARLEQNNSQTQQQQGTTN